MQAHYVSGPSSVRVLRVAPPNTFRAEADIFGTIPTGEEWQRLALPELTVDLDGVLCRPVLWFNVAISRDIQRPPDFRERPLGSSSGIAQNVAYGPLVQALRYSWRPSLPRVREGLAGLVEIRRLVLLSGRSELARGATESWLIRHRLREYFSDVILNDRGLPNVSFKILICRERVGTEHVDDDGRVAFFLARCTARKVYLISYARNDQVAYPPGVLRVRDLVEAARLMRANSATDS